MKMNVVLIMIVYICMVCIVLRTAVDLNQLNV